MLAIHGAVADFTEHLDRIPGQTPRLGAFLGGTIGNLLPDERAAFLGELRKTLAPGDWLLLGADLAAEVTLPELALDIVLQTGEEIRTEISAKFRSEGLER